MKNYFLLVVTGTFNDGNSIDESTLVELDFELSPKSYRNFHSSLDAVCQLIQENGCKWHTGDRGSLEEDYDFGESGGNVGDLIEWFSKYVPYAEYGIESISSVKLYEISKETKLI